jgi:hypothetical protein
MRAFFLVLRTALLSATSYAKARGWLMGDARSSRDTEVMAGTVHACNGMSESLRSET